MRARLEILDGPHAGRSFELKAGQLGRVGSGRLADFPVAGDPAMAGLHFAFACGEAACSLRALDPNAETLVNGEKALRTLVRDGDRIRAGATTFLVRVESGAARADPPVPAPATDAAPKTESAATLGPTIVVGSPAPWKRQLLRILQQQPQPLFAVLDAARTPEVLAMVLQERAPSRSLYEGPEGDALMAVAPHLVELPAGSPALDTLVERGWGDAWGIYLTCGRPFAEVRKHLRRFLLTELEGGERVYFRFYDPRVLRVFLPTCDGAEAAQFFGPIGSFLVEGDDPETLLRFVRSESGARRFAEPIQAARG